MRGEGGRGVEWKWARGGNGEMGKYMGTREERREGRGLLDFCVSFFLFFLSGVACRW